MKRSLTIISLLGLIGISIYTTITATTAKSTDSNNAIKGNISYTLGYTTGKHIMKNMEQDIKLDVNEFSAGIHDAINQKKGRFTTAEMKKILSDFEEQLLFNTQKKVQDTVIKNHNQLVNDKLSPVDGNPKGNITLVEFFDYQCVHCRNLSPNLEKLKQHDSSLRIVYKEFPIFGEKSIFASKVALAAKKQGKYNAMHAALMGSKTPLTQEHVLALAKKANLNIKQLQKDINDPTIMKELQKNQQLAQALGINVTPSLIITSTSPVQPSAKNPQNINDLTAVFIPGAVPAARLQQVITQLRSKVVNQTNNTHNKM